MKKREGEVKYSLDWLATTRQHAISMWKEALETEDKEEIKAWEFIILDLEDEMATRGKELRMAKGFTRTGILLMVVFVNILVLLSIVCSSCQTYKGLTGDAGWILTKTSENIVIDKEK